MGAYNHKYDNVADIYDTYVTVDYDVDFWVNKAQGVSEVLELTAGTGRVTIPIAKSGVKVTALDISEKLLEDLRKKKEEEKLDIEVVQGDMTSFSFDRKFPLIIIPFHSLQELLKVEEHKSCLCCILEHLEDSGKFIFSVNNPSSERIKMLSGLRVVNEKVDPKTGNEFLLWYLRENYDDSPVGVSRQFYEEYDKDGVMLSKRYFKNNFYIFKKEEIEALLEEIGFKIDAIYGEYDEKELGADSRFLIYELSKKP